MNLVEVHKAHKHCRDNQKEIKSSKLCGCFYCCNTFEPGRVKEWIDKGGKTALCPFCSIDAVLGDASGVPITSEFLKAMSNYWFSVKKEA